MADNVSAVAGAWNNGSVTGWATDQNDGHGDLAAADPADRAAADPADRLRSETISSASDDLRHSSSNPQDIPVDDPNDPNNTNNPSWNLF